MLALCVMILWFFLPFSSQYIQFFLRDSECMCSHYMCDIKNLIEFARLPIPHWQRDLLNDDDDERRKQRGDCEKDINMWRYFDVCAITLVVCAEWEQISQSNGY